jgi:OOP family OmpA-OmpF porin
MTTNLLDILKGYFSNEVIGLAGNFLGESEGNTRSAVEQVLPTLLGGLIAKSSTPAGANSLINMLNDRTHDGSILNDLMGVFAGGDKSNAFMRMGSSVLGNIFGDKVGGVVDLISGNTGMRKESSANLLSFLAPIVLGLLGKTKKDQGLNASGLLSLILGQGSFLKNVLPAGLGSILGFSGGIDNLVNTAYGNLSGTYKFDAANLSASSANSSQRATVTTSNDDNGGGGMGWLKWLLPLLLLGVLGWFLMGKGCGAKVEDAAQTTMNAAGDAAQSAANAAGDAANAAGDAAQSAANAAGDAANAAANAAGECR